MTKIKPIKLSLNKGTASEIVVRPINIELYKDSCDSYWELFEVIEKSIITDGVEEIQVAKKLLETGNMPIPSEIYLNWDDDAPIEDYVIEQLGLERL